MRLLHRALLRCYPPSFRREHGDEIVAFWELQRQEARYAGQTGRIRYAVDIGSDALKRGVRLRIGGQAWSAARAGRDAHRSGSPRKGDGWMKTIVHDLRYAVRSLKGSPVYTGIAVTTLALGIASTTAWFWR